MKCWKCRNEIKGKKFLTLDRFALYERYHWICKECFDKEDYEL